MIKFLYIALLAIAPTTVGKENTNFGRSKLPGTTLIETLSLSIDPSITKIVLLSIDGGGVHTIIPLMILAELEKLAGKPCSEIFNFYAGVSAGSMATAILNGTPQTPKLSAYETSNLFAAFVEKLFSRTFTYRLKSGFGLFRPIFDGTYKDEVFAKVFDSIKITDLNSNAFFLVTDVDTAEPHIFGKTFNSLEHENEFYLREIINASTATPVFFPSVVVQSLSSGKTYNFVDGGISRNDMAGLAFELIQVLYPNAKVHILSLGANIKNCVKSVDRVKWGLLQWVFRCDILSIIIKSATVTTSELLAFKAERQSLKLASYFRIEPIVPSHLNSSFNPSPSYIQELKNFGKWVANEHQDDLQKFLNDISTSD